MEMTAALLAYETDEEKRKSEQKSKIQIIKFPLKETTNLQEGDTTELSPELCVKQKKKIEEKAEHMTTTEQEIQKEEKSRRNILFAKGCSRIDSGKIFKFTEKELSEMPENVRKYLRINGYRVGKRIKENGVIELRIQIQKICLSASSKDLGTARKKLLEKINQLQVEDQFNPENRELVNQNTNTVPTFKEFAVFWLENIKRPEIKESSLSDISITLNKHIFPSLGDIKLNKLQIEDVLKLIHQYGQSRTATKIYTNLKSIFKIAHSKGYMKENLLLYIKPPVYEAKKGVPFTLEEEARFVKRCIEEGDDGYALILQLYIGARRSELKTARIEGDFIRIENAKQRKGKKVTSRKIPISPMLRPYIPNINFEYIRNELPDDKLSRLVPILTDGNHHDHELRHTFSNRCQSCHVDDKIVSFWLNHSYGDTMTLRTYTNLPDEYFLEEIQKVHYELPMV